MNQSVDLSVKILYCVEFILDLYLDQSWMFYFPTIWCFSGFISTRINIILVQCCFCFEIIQDFEKVNIDEAKYSVCECVCVCVYVRRQPYLRNNWSEMYQIKIDMVTVHYIDLDLHSRLHRFWSWNNKCLIISETVQAMLIKFAVKIVYIIFDSLMTLTFSQGHNFISDLTIF